jgi:hypothetical protein
LERGGTALRRGVIVDVPGAAQVVPAEGAVAQDDRFPIPAADGRLAWTLGHGVHHQIGRQQHPVAAHGGARAGQNLARVGLGQHDPHAVQDTQGGLVNRFDFFLGQNCEQGHLFSPTKDNVNIVEKQLYLYVYQ